MWIYSLFADELHGDYIKMTKSFKRHFQQWLKLHLWREKDRLLTSLNIITASESVSFTRL